MSNHPLYHKATAFCSRAERCPQEVRLWLEKRGVPPSEQEQIIQALTLERYLDEERFIRAYTADKLRFNQRGPLRITQELRAKNLPEGLINRLVADVMEENNYREILRTLLEKKLQAIEGNSPDVITRNVIQWAYGKGFEIDTILEELRQLTSL